MSKVEFILVREDDTRLLRNKFNNGFYLINYMCEYAMYKCSTDTNPDRVWKTKIVLKNN